MIFQQTVLEKLESYIKEVKLDHYVTSYIKKFKLNKSLVIGPEILKSIENIDNTFNFGYTGAWGPDSKWKRTKINKWNCIKLQTSVH